MPRSLAVCTMHLLNINRVMDKRKFVMFIFVTKQHKCSSLKVQPQSICPRITQIKVLIDTNFSTSFKHSNYRMLQLI